MTNGMNLRIEELCKQRGLRMSDLAAKMGVNQANLTSSLKGNPTVSRLEAVANVLGGRDCRLIRQTVRM